MCLAAGRNIAVCTDVSLCFEIEIMTQTAKRLISDIVVRLPLTEGRDCVHLEKHVGDAAIQNAPQLFTPRDVRDPRLNRPANRAADNPKENRKYRQKPRRYSRSV